MLEAHWRKRQAQGIGFLLGSLLVLFCAAPPAHAQDTTRLSLEQAVAVTLNRHPLLKAATHFRKAADHGLQEVRSANYPQLSFNTSLTRWDWLLPNKQVMLGNSLNDLYAEFTVQQLVYDGGRTARKSDIARNTVEVEDVARRQLEQTLVFAVTEAYLQLLKAQRNVAVREMTLANLRNHQTSAELLYRSGIVSELDVLKAQTQIALATEDLASTRNSVTARRQGLLGAMGVDSAFDFQVIDVTEAVWQRDQERPFREDSLLLVLRRHPDLQRAALGVSARENEVSLARSDYYPALFVRGAYNWEDSQILPGNNNWNIGIGISVPILRGGATKAGIEQARSRTEAARATQQAVWQKLHLAVQVNLTNLEDARGRVRSGAELVRLAERSERVATLVYRAGKGSSLDVLDTEMVLTTVRLSYIQALTDYALARAQLDFNLGSMAMPYHPEDR